MKINSKKLVVKKDERGNLIEILKPQDIGNGFHGQIFLTTAKPGKTKGNHYHLRKTEWYCVIKGQGKLILTDIKTKEKIEKILTADEIELVEISPNNFHSITNIGDEDLYLIVYVNEVYNVEDPDTFYTFS